MENILPDPYPISLYVANEPTPQHLPYVSLKKKFPKEFKHYKKFTIVRNPWSRLVSDYVWQRKFTQIDISFLDFIRSIDRIIDASPGWPLTLAAQSVWQPFAVGHFIPQHCYVESDVRVLLFENLNDDFTKMCLEWDLPLPDLPHLNASAHKPYRSYYRGTDGPEIIRLALKHFEQDMNQFGYPTDPFK